MLALLLSLSAASDGHAHDAAVVDVAVRIDSAVSTVASNFVGVNADWWLNGCGGEGKQWSSNASVALVDLTNPNLKALAKGLAGATWRIGGTHQDSVIYQVGNSTQAEECRAHKHTHCYPICLTMQRWEDILAFGAEANLSVVFGVNFKLDSYPTNLLDFLDYTRRKELQVSAFEFGNELGISNIERYGSVVAGAVASLWAGREDRPMAVGPDDAGDGTSAPAEKEILQLVGEQDFLQAITFHAYTFHNGGGPTPSLVAHMMNTTLLDEGMLIYQDVLAAVKAKSRPAYSPQVWMGEGNAAGHGGRLTVTNTFINSFWYLTALGSSSRLGIHRFLRQAFIGGDYELVNRTTFLPNPDYFVALLWQQLCGPRILGTNTSLPAAAAAAGTAPPADVKVFAACAKPGSSLTAGLPVAHGDVVVVSVNFANASAQVAVAPSAARLTWYVQSAVPGVLRSAEVALLAAGGRWEPLRLRGGQLPAMPPVAEAGGTAIKLPAHSYAFSILQGSRAPACVA